MFFKKKKQEDKKEITILNVEDNFDTDVDPLAEADVYLAYGREKQAMEILNEALEKKSISIEQYEQFLKDKKVSLSKKEQINNKKEDYSYYISITTGNNSFIIRGRTIVHLKNKINTTKGLRTVVKKSIHFYLKTCIIK